MAFMAFTPYHVFSLVSPICLPIYGSYNDYGSIELIDDTPMKMPNNLKILPK